MLSPVLVHSVFHAGKVLLSPRMLCILSLPSRNAYNLSSLGCLRLSMPVRIDLRISPCCVELDFRIYLGAGQRAQLFLWLSL